MNTPAFIDLYVECAKCGNVLYSGAYRRGIIGKLRSEIKQQGWIHTDFGTLCPECKKGEDNATKKIKK